jgi:hypothetical protein
MSDDRTTAGATAEIQLPHDDAVLQGRLSNKPDFLATSATFLSWLDQFPVLLSEADPVRQAVAEVFNPPDLDEDETLILLNALFAARDFIAESPCTCRSDEHDEEMACRRCALLGRLADERQDR